MNDKAIWDFFIEKLDNPYGTAALMGNLYVESHLNPQNLQSNGEKKLGMTDEEYTNAVDNGTYTNFVHDGFGYGLAQWTYWSRKEALLNYASGSSIGDLYVQLSYMWEELQSYKTVIEALKTATNVRDASEVVTRRYEKPRTITEKTLQTRSDMGQLYYDKFSNLSTGNMVVATANVNIRVGNGKEYAKVGLLKKGSSLPYVATSINNWFAVKFNTQVCWVSGEFSILK